MQPAACAEDRWTTRPNSGGSVSVKVEGDPLLVMSSPLTESAWRWAAWSRTGRIGACCRSACRPWSARALPRTSFWDGAQAAGGVSFSIEAQGDGLLLSSCFYEVCEKVTRARPGEQAQGEAASRRTDNPKLPIATLVNT
jgi:hypothetical protein